MLTTSASTLAPRARLAQSRVLGGARALAATSTTTAMLIIRHRQQQTRGFRFGWWGDNMDREQHREMRRRYKALHHKYSDAVNRKLLWEQQHASNGEMPRPYRRFAHHYWQPKRCFAFTRYRSSNKGTVFKSPENPMGTRPGHTIEDVERNAWGHLLFRDNDGKQPSWASPFDEIRSYIAKRQSEIMNDSTFEATPNVPQSTSASTSTFSSASAFAATNPVESESDYVIDPITNRKVTKSSAKSTPDESAHPPATSVNTFDTDLPPTQTELHAYKNVTIDEIPSTKPGDAAVADSVHFDGLASQQPKYNDLHKYKPIEYNEPDGKLPEAEPATYNPEELRKYQPVTWNEPDGQSTEAPVEIGHEGYDPEEVQKYKPFKWNEPDGKPLDKPVELGHEGYDPEELAKYKPFHWNEPDGQPTTPPAEVGHAGYDPVEVQKYQAFMWNEPHGKLLEETVELGHHGYDPAEVQQYQAFRHNEPDGKPAVATGELGHEGYDPAEVQTYKAFRYNEPDGKAPDAADDVVDSSELASYGAVRYQEPDGKPAFVADLPTDSLKEYDVKSADVEVSEEIYSKILQRLETLTPLDGEEPAPGSGSRGSSSGSGSASAPSKQSKASSGSQDRSALESSMTRINAEHDAIDKLASVSVKSSKIRARKQLSDAERKQAHIDPYSTEPQGLETAYTEECEREATGPAYVKVHKRVDRPALESTPGPFVYKILAYNPTMQTIDIAETSSAVPDSASPLPPAEVMLRLSNPAKFFPHFETLRAQGFEIVSGSGDVLIFRKVQGHSDGGEQFSPKKKTQRTLPTSTVNPIDMTGKRYVPPSTANFVSPTGYVNLDLPPLFENASTTNDLPSPPPSASASAEPISRRFQSNIGVRREEPVFSGPKDSKAGTTNGKPSVAKRMVVGATWVAGVSYALGVASEFVKGR